MSQAEPRAKSSAGDRAAAKLATARFNERRHDFVVQIERAARAATPTVDPWFKAAAIAQIGLFIITGFACLYVMGAILMPILVAWVVATILDPVTDWLQSRGLRRWVAVSLVVIVLILAALFLLTLLSLPIAYWLDRANELGALIRAKMREMSQPMEMFKQLSEIFGQAAASDGRTTVTVQQGPGIITSILGVVTPAVSQTFLFSLALVFLLVYQNGMRSKLVLLMPDRDQRLQMLRILSDIDRNMTLYFGTLTLVNIALGAATALVAYLAGLPNPLLWGVLAAVMNYLPYIGLITVTATLFVVGLLSLPSLLAACVAPAAYLIVNSIESEIITPTLIGQRLTLNPFAVFLSIAFWSWMWGPTGAFLAVPLLIAGMVAFRHISDDPIDLPQ